MENKMKRLTPEEQLKLEEFLLSTEWGPFLWIGRLLLERFKDAVVTMDPSKRDVAMEVARYQGAEKFFKALQEEALRLKKKAQEKIE